MKLFWIIFWEFVQTLPLIAAFSVAVWLWAQNHRTTAAVCALVGGGAGALVIRFTEPKISGTLTEQVEVTLVNTAIMSFAMITCAAYLASESRYSNWKLDLILGGSAGIILGTAQGLATPGITMVDFVFHCLAFTITPPIALISIRAAKAKDLSSSLVISVFVTFFMAVIISLVDYGEFLF